MHTDFHES